MPDRPDSNPSPAPQIDVTGLLQRAEQGDTEALGAAFEAVGAELRRMAADALRRNPGDGLLQATALVHESYIKTAESCATDGLGERARWQDRVHFVRSQKETMKNLLVDAARRRSALRRGGGALGMVANEESLGLASPADDT
jgi:DNA-directed RNA polymerase specialized sigma24 family protein